MRMSPRGSSPRAGTGPVHRRRSRVAEPPRLIGSTLMAPAETAPGMRAETRDRVAHERGLPLRLP